MAQANPPDLILLDIMMPDMDGLAVCNTIRQQRKLRHLPIVMFTAKTQAQNKKASFESGADDYLTKPTRPAELINRVEAILARAEAKQAKRSEDPAPPEAATDETAPVALPEAKEQRLIAVLGTRGGAGATTVAVNLAASLADYGHNTTLIDLDTHQGHVAVYLGHEVQQDLRALLNRAPESIDRFLINHQDRFRLLLTRSDLGFGGGDLSERQVEALTETLIPRDDCIVVDLGRNTGRNVYPLLQQASHVLICLRPERAAIMAAKTLIDRLGEVVPQPENLHALMLNFGTVDNVPRRPVERYLGVPLLDVLTIDPRYVANAVNRKKPLIHVHPTSVQTRHIRKLARRLVPV